jgi:nucleoside phosphorylase
MTDFEQVRAACGQLLLDGDLHGTTFLISPTLAITTAHNVQSGGQFEVRFQQTVHPARVITESAAADAAILQLDSPVEGIQPLLFSFDVRRGDNAYIYGFPFAFRGTGLSIDARIQDPRIDVPRIDNPLLLLAVSADITAETQKGLSGAPVVVGDAVVGILAGSFSEYLNHFLCALRIQDVLELLPPQEYARATRRSRTGERIVEQPQPSVAVIAALDEELDYLLELPYNWSGPRATDDGITYRIGQMENGPGIVASSANSMGLTATAILTAKVIKEWSPRLISMIGVCGGRKEKGVALGDIVVPTQTFHYQFGSFKDGVIHRELRVENSDAQLLDIVSHLARRTDVLARIKQSLPRGFVKPRTDLQCHLGPLASADLVVKDTAKFGEAIEADRKTIGVEMESYAFMKAAALARVRWALVVKSVSDYADATKDDEVREYAKYTSARFFVEVARMLMSDGHIGPAK